MTFPIETLFYLNTIHQSIEKFDGFLLEESDISAPNNVDKFFALKILNEVSKRFPFGSEYINGYLRIIINDLSETNDKFNNVDFKQLNNRSKNNEFFWVIAFLRLYRFYCMLLQMNLHQSCPLLEQKLSNQKSRLKALRERTKNPSGNVKE
jgi:hypothetical protein